MIAWLHMYRCLGLFLFYLQCCCTYALDLLGHSDIGTGYVNCLYAMFVTFLVMVTYSHQEGNYMQRSLLIYLR